MQSLDLAAIAHQAMIDAVNGMQFSEDDIDAFFKSVQELVSAVKILRK